MIYLSDLIFLTCFKTDFLSHLPQHFTGLFVVIYTDFTEFNNSLRKEKGSSKYHIPDKQFY